MQICKKCNGKNEDNANFCEHCGEALKELNEIFKEKYVMNSNILLAENEVNVRSYLCTKLPLIPFLNITPLAGSGYVSITNKRVVYYGESGKHNMFSSEVAIDTVTGFKTQKSVNYRILLFLICFALTIAATAQVTDEANGFLGFIVFIIGFIITLLVARKKTYTFTVYSNGSQPSALDISASGFSTNVASLVTNSIFGNFKMKLNPLPAKDSIKVTNEIGAIVMDIKNLGDFALEKWCTNTINIKNTSKTTESNKNTSKVQEAEDDGEFF